MFTPNKSTGETLEESSPVPPINGEETMEIEESSPMQSMFDGLDEEEKEELCDIVIAYKDSQMKSPRKGEVDLEPYSDEEDEEEMM